MTWKLSICSLLVRGETTKLGEVIEGKVEVEVTHPFSLAVGREGKVRRAYVRL